MNVYVYSMHLLTDLHSYLFQLGLVGYGNKLYLVVTLYVVPYKELNDAHRRDEDRFEHLPALKPGKCEVDTVQQIRILMQSVLRRKDHIYLP